MAKLHELKKGATYIDTIGNIRQPYIFTGNFSEVFFGPNCSEYCAEFMRVCIFTGKIGKPVYRSTTLFTNHINPQ